MVTVHRWALPLTAALVALFVAATALYAWYGYAVVLSTFEVSQIARAEEATGSRVVREYQDYLRVDPESLMVRGLLINRLIEERRGADAVEVAQRGVEVASAEDKLVAELLLARAKMGNGDLDEAEKIYEGLLEKLGESGEAHCGLAHIYAAKGEFDKVRDEFAFLGSESTRLSSDDFAVELEKLTSRRSEIDFLGSVVTFATNPEYARMLRLTGDFERSQEMLAKYRDSDSLTSRDCFWLGIGQEEHGNFDEARRYYRMAAEQRDPLAIAALERLGRTAE